jgi:23S rRNA (cytidine1920-2'-O)/16S rRNA (cytidine1409-2'-O)-methyltransferase
VKRHLHILVVEKGLAKEEKIARAKIMAGEIMVGGEVITKPGWLVDETAELTAKERPRYVSRGGAKLASVARKLKLDFDGKTVLDVGSSTGGFTDFALQNGAVRVYDVDSGTAQLAYKLRMDPRVVPMEKTDIRSIDTLPDPIDITVMDVSFISVTLVLEAVVNLVGQTPIVVMVKPQFEAAKGVTDATKGIIPSESIRQHVLGEFRDWAHERFEIIAEADSDVTGMHGNRERFFLLRAKS